MRSILQGPPIPGDELLDAFQRSLSKRGLSPVTVHGYLNDLDRLARNWALLHAHIIPNGMYDFSGC